MSIINVLARRGLAMAVAVVLSGSFHPLAFDTAAIAAVIQKTDTGRLYSGDGPIIRIGLITDATSVSLSSPFGLNVRRLTTGDRDDGRVAVSTVRVEVRRRPASVARKPKSKADEKDSPAGYKPRSRYTEAAGRPGELAAGPGNLQVVAFEANSLLASSEDVMIVSPADDPVERPVSYSDKKGDRSEKAGANGAEQSKLSRRNDREAKRPADKDGDKVRAVDKAAPAPGKPRFIRVGNKEYRGEIHLLLNRRGRINVINSLPMEEYLRGVVPLELSPGSFPEIEALKAQAIAARSYALARQGRYSSEGYDLKDTAESQVYGGLSAEHPLTNRAVEETRGMVALYSGEDGRLSPIEALYTSTCGGRTENNESVFLGPASPYLRSVECAPDRHVAERREIASSRSAEPLAGIDGRGTARDVALLEVLGFALPGRVTAEYLRGQADHAELLRWAARLAALARREKLRAPRGEATRLPAFARLISSAIYGEDRARLLLPPADVKYILSGLASADVLDDARADVAMLLKQGIMRVPSEGRVSARTVVTRAYAIETLARAMRSKPELAGLISQTASSVEGNRLAITEQGATEPVWLEVEQRAWLFRRLGEESYPVASLLLVGGERITYHLNAAGRVDFLEADFSDRGASSDRYSNLSRWQERVTPDELRRRLARSNISVGEVEEILPVGYGASNRVLELEIVGREGRQRLRGFRIRTALGLKETLFVVDTERDERGRAVAFVFTGRGWGHGVGLCQTGAYGLAKEGYSSIAIIQKYYTGVKVQKIY